MADNVAAVCIRGLAESKVAVKLDASDALKPPESKRVELEKVYNTWGSCAGSGSDAFPIYRRHRNAELERLEKMDKDWDSLKSAESFQAKREAMADADDAATEAKRSKRQRKKEAKVAGAKARKAAEGVNQFAGDGSFLDAMKTMDPAEFEAEEKKRKEAEAASARVNVPTVSVAQMSSSSNITIRDVE
mmetsp:Transcript_93890/g.201566  ORF Transcript_93890/g.201566 Transcript_93890/m.201566 type:complete len:189 (+) Transcript_93890:44-610(+)